MPNEHLIPNPYSGDASPGRAIHPEPLRLAEPGWPRPHWASGEIVQRREGDVTADERAAAREWLRHVEAGSFSAPERGGGPFAEE